MSTSYPLARGGVKVSVPVSPRFKKRLRSALAEHALPQVADCPSSVQNVYEYGLGYPDGVSAIQVQKALKLSRPTVERAHKVLQQRGLATFTEERYRRGRRVLWTYSVSRPLVDLTDGQQTITERSSEAVQQTITIHSEPLEPMMVCWTEINRPMTRENTLTEAQVGGAAVMKVSQSPGSTGSVQGVSDSLLPSFARERASSRAGAIHRELWVDQDRDEAPVLAHYRNAIEQHGYRVYDQQADGIWLALATMVENYGVAETLAFVDHLLVECDHPYLANPVDTFVRSWADRRTTRPQVVAATPAPQPAPVRPHGQSATVVAKLASIRALRAPAS